MPNESIESITAAPAFKALVKRRTAVTLGLTAAMLAVYFGFLLLIAFNKELLARKLTANLTLGLPLGLGTILFTWLITGIYVFWANHHYDPEVEEFKRQLKP